MGRTQHNTVKRYDFRIPLLHINVFIISPFQPLLDLSIFVCRAMFLYGIIFLLLKKFIYYFLKYKTTDNEII